MKPMKHFIAGCIAVMALSAASIGVFAAEYQTPAEAVAGITGKTTEQVAQERLDGKSYGTIAAEAGKLAEFQQAMLEIRKDALDARVSSGAITRQQADDLLAAMQERQAVCNGAGNGAGGGCGLGIGGGYGRGRGNGMGMRGGVCIYQ